MTIDDNGEDAAAAANIAATSGNSNMQNPHSKRPPLGPHNSNMGRQSQQHVSNAKRKCQLAATNSCKKNKSTEPGNQLALFGEKALDPTVDCMVCAAHEKKKFRLEVTIPHRPHHVTCPKNKVTAGRGSVSQQQVSVQMTEVLGLLNKTVSHFVIASLKFSRSKSICKSCAQRPCRKKKKRLPLALQNQPQHCSLLHSKRIKDCPRR